MIDISFAQSNRWLFGRDYVDVLATTPNTTLPALAVNFSNFSGWNMRHDQNLNLSFCVQNGKVYDENTADLGEIFVNTDAGLDEFYGYPEICIVPVPGSCSRYYIIGAYKYNFGATSGTGTNPKPAYSIIDMSVYNNFAGAFGSLDGANAVGDVVASDITNGAGGWTNFNVHTSEMHLAVTRPRIDGSRILFISSGGYVYTSIINSTGVSIATLRYASMVNTGGSGSSTLKSELEVYEEVINGMPNYKLAIPWGNNANYLEVVQFDPNLNPINDFLVGPILAASNGEPLKGIEFSPNGQYIYYTTTGPDYLNCIDATNGVSVPLPNVNQNDLIKYGYSMIETGKDLNLYMVCSDCVSLNDPIPHTVLTQLNDPNNPSNLTFVDNWAELNYSHLDVSGVVPFSTFSAGSQIIGVNIMPDQQDGEDYLATFNTDKICCNFITEYHVDQFSAEESETWTPTSNPLNGGTGSVAMIKNELEISSGVTVHIVGMELQFSLTGKIIVHPGAKLFIESTKLTGNPICETMWKGIEVWSDIPTSTMGEIYTLPDATIGTRSSIEQAIVGINFADANNTLPTNPMVGGFMIVDRTDFKNNYIAISYKNSPINGQASQIYNCEFNSDLGGLWYPHAGENAGVFLLASNIKANHLQLLGLDNKFDRAYYGIYLSETSSIQINDADFDHCVAAIYSLRPSNTGSASALNISSNTFKNTHTCIYILNGFEDQISSNVFNSTYGPQFQNFYGVFMDGSNGFRIVDNVFNHIKFGAFIYNSGPRGGVIDANAMGNVFNECWRGIHTEKNNEALQIRCNEFNNVNQGAFDFSAAWYINGDLPDQGQPGTIASAAAGNYFYRSGNRQELHSVMGNQANSCSGAHNFCYFKNQSPSSVDPLVATPSTISKWTNPYTQTSCTARAKIMELANNDPHEAMVIIESETNNAIKAQYTLELSKWFKNQEQIDSLIVFLQELNTEGSLEQLYSEYIQMDSIPAAQAFLSELVLSGNEELIAFASLNQILLNLKSDGKSILEMDSMQLSTVDEFANSEWRVSGQARAIKAAIDDILQPIELVSDTGSYRLANGDLFSSDTQAAFQLLNNPAHNYLDVNFSSTHLEGKLQVTIFDVLGKEITTLTLPVSSRLNIPLENISNGNYILSISQAKQKIGALNFSKF